MQAATQATPQLAPVRQNGTIHPAVKGYWKSIGNGYLLNASADSILLYSYTTHYCYKEKNDYSEGLLNSQATFTIHGDTLSIFPSDYGKNTSRLQVKNDYVRINALPENTISFSEMQQLSPVKLFDLYNETMQENYAFSKERQLNWKAIAAEYRKKLTDQQAFAYSQRSSSGTALKKDNANITIPNSIYTIPLRRFTVALSSPVSAAKKWYPTSNNPVSAKKTPITKRRSNNFFIRFCFEYGLIKDNVQYQRYS
jgi:hypothetical protein